MKWSSYVWDLPKRRKYPITLDNETEGLLETDQETPEPSIDRPASTGLVAGVALSAPDEGQDYPAFAANVGQENRIKVWELYRILDTEEGLRSRRAIRYPVRQRN